MRTFTQSEIVILINNEIDKLNVEKYRQPSNGFDKSAYVKHCNNILDYINEIDNLNNLTTPANKLTPAEDGEMFGKAAAYVASLEGHDVVDFLMEVLMHTSNPERMVEIQLAALEVIEGWKDIQECA